MTAARYRYVILKTGQNSIFSQKGVVSFQGESNPPDPPGAYPWWVSEHGPSDPFLAVPL